MLVSHNSINDHNVLCDWHNMWWGKDLLANKQFFLSFYVFSEVTKNGLCFMFQLKPRIRISEKF